MKAEERSNEYAKYSELPDYSADIDEHPDFSGVAPARSNALSSLSIGAKTAAGIGLGIVFVVAGTAVLATGAEVALIPTLLLKLAGGTAGGGLGLVKGITDNRKNRRR